MPDLQVEFGYFIQDNSFLEEKLVQLRTFLILF